MHSALNRLRHEELLRRLEVEEAGLDFSSNDYLGMSRSVPLRKALIEALQSGLPLGATGSRLLSGTTETHLQAEGSIAATFGFESALLFSSGYLANLAVMGAFAAFPGPLEFFSDSLNHASLIDGMRLSRGARSVFERGNLAQLENLLQSSKAETRVIVTESVHGMEGDLAPLDSILEIANRHGAWLVVDEAHATGVFGKCGHGVLEELAYDPERTIAIHTGGKALGAQGAFVLSVNAFRDLMVNVSRACLFTTALAPLQALQLELALRFIDFEDGARCLARARQLRKRLGLPDAGSQIVPFRLGSNAKALHVASKLRAQGFRVRAIRSPTVAVGTERLRLSCKSFHSEVDIDRLATSLGESLEELSP